MPTGVPQRERPRAKPLVHSHAAGQRTQGRGNQRDLAVTNALDRAIDVVILPVAGVGRVLSARAGLMRYARRGVLAAADLMAWPFAAATGLGSAVLNRWGPLHQPPKGRRSPAGRSGPAIRSRPPADPKPQVRSRPAAAPKPSVRSRPVAGPKPSARSKPAARPQSAARRTGTRSASASGTRRG